MSLTPVESSNIQAVGYDPESQALTIQFKDGVSYTYADVPAEAHAGLMGVDTKGHSIGKFFHANIKGVYTAEKVED